MEGPALRDVERWKDKIEVRLDNRQVFFLFFGSALVACMLFVLGVLVGKRIESRGRAEAPAIDDPLAVLDRFGSRAVAPTHDTLTFPGKLIVAGGGGTRARVASQPGSRDERPASHESRVAARPVLTTAAPAGATVGPMPSDIPPAMPAAPAPEARLARPVGSPERRPSASGLDTPGIARPPARSGSPAPAPAPVGGERARGHFLLQLSSFQDKAEADAFARRFAGKDAYVVPTELPGKGTWYRVRVGSYSTMQEASSAKIAFEREHNVIAYVAGSGPSK